MLSPTITGPFSGLSDSLIVVGDSELVYCRQEIIIEYDITWEVLFQIAKNKGQNLHWTFNYLQVWTKICLLATSFFARFQDFFALPSFQQNLERDFGNFRDQQGFDLPFR